MNLHTNTTAYENGSVHRHPRPQLQKLAQQALIVLSEAFFTSGEGTDVIRTFVRELI